MSINYCDADDLMAHGLDSEKARFVAANYSLFESSDLYFLNARNGSLTAAELAKRPDMVKGVSVAIFLTQIARERVFGTAFTPFTATTDGAIIQAMIEYREELRRIVRKFERKNT